MPASNWDTASSAPSRSMPIADLYWWPDKTMDRCPHSRYGMTSAPLTDDHGEVVLSSFLEGFPVKTSPLPTDPDKASTATDLASGWKWPGSLAKWDRDTCSWKTRQLSLLEASTVYSGTWPRWGTMRTGEFWEQTMSALPTAVNASGYWATPSVPNGGRVSKDTMSQTGVMPDGTKRQVGLDHQVKMVDKGYWPTPTVKGNDNRAGLSPKAGDGLQTAVNRYPTPTSSMMTVQDQEQARFSGMDPKRPAYKDAWPTPMARDAKNGDDLNQVIGGKLSPMWVEWLMGWPIGWTDLKPLVTDRSPLARQPPGRF